MTITTTTKQMYDAFTATAFDTFDTPGAPGPLYGSMIEVLNSLIMGNMEGIRKAFKDGMTPLLLPGHMDTIDNLGREDIEVRVTCSNTGKLIGIIIDSELNY